MRKNFLIPLAISLALVVSPVQAQSVEFLRTHPGYAAQLLNNGSLAGTFSGGGVSRSGSGSSTPWPNWTDAQKQVFINLGYPASGFEPVSGNGKCFSCN